MEYTDKVLDHFKNPRNQGSIESPDGVGKLGNPACGDVMKIYISVEDDKIRDIKFETMGCAAAIAVSSAMTEIVKGKSLDEADKITKDEVVEYLGGLPRMKIHCSALGIDALKEAIKNYKNK
jgi:nitrogen fixation NifU-like protein